MEKNVGTLDSHIRLIAGFSMLGMGILRSSKAMIGLGAMKIATGISRFCPILYMLKLSTADPDTSMDKIIKKIPEYANQMAENLGME